MGSMALWRLTRRTSDVIGFDAQHLGSDRTGLGGDTRLFRKAYKEGREFSDLLNLSEQMFHELNSEGVNAFAQHGGLSIGSSEGDYITSLRASVQASGAEHEALTHSDLSRRYPQHALLPDDVGILDPAGGFIRTDEAVLGALELASLAGAELRTQESIQQIVPHKNAVEIVSNGGNYLVDHVVIAAGAWSKRLLPESLATKLSARSIPLTWFLARNPSEFEPDKFPIFVRESGGVHMYGAPTVDGATVKVAGLVENSDAQDPSNLNRSLSRNEADSANSGIRRFFPGLFPSCVRADAYPDLYTPDMVPVVGFLKDAPRVYVATGFSGRGFKMAAGIGEVIARELAGESSKVSMEFARPGRLTA